jgi:Cd2+/Zn2+-exporting ATPase
MATRNLTLTALCPPEPHRRERCASCLRERLLATPGVRRVALSEDNADASTGGGDGDCVPVTLELDYDPRLMPLQELDAELRRAGLECRAKRATALLGIEGMASPRSEPLIEASLAKLPGVVASASFAGRSLRVEFDPSRCALGEIVRHLAAHGLRVHEGGPLKRSAPLSDRKSIQRLRELILTHHKLAMALIGGALVLAAFLAYRLGGPPILRYAFVALGIVLAGWYTAIDTWRVLRAFKFDIDVLMFAAAFGAVVLGHYEEGGLLLVLFALGGAGEELAMDKARKAIEALAKLAPEVATVRGDDGADRAVRVEELAVGDRVVVRPFDRLPADGTVESGASAVDQAPITGESVPVEKTAGAAVFAGTINGAGLLLVRVSRPASESTLAKIVRMVQEAQTTKSPTQIFTDRVEKRYVPFVLITTAALIFIPPLMFAQAWATWFYRAMAFLTAASPCALAIGTPAAVLSGIARAAQVGVLVKGGVHLENLGRIRAVAFDKTGTLTVGRPQVTRILPLDAAMSEDRVLSLAASADASATHPAATAIVAEAESRSLPLFPAEEVTTLAGKGASARVEGMEIYVGKLSPEVVADPRIAPLAEQGIMLAQVSIDGRPSAVICLADTPRPNAAATVAALHDLGIRPLIMLTGDRAAVANPIAQSLGVDEVHADLLPEDKVTRVRDLQQRYGPIAMIGDGVNDAPALATAAVGIAMGGAGTDVAIETADVALMGDDLSKLPDAVALSRYSRRIITQNLVIALGVITVLAPLAALGYTYLGVAVLFHEGSTVVVVLNAMRILLFKPKRW